MVKKTTDKFEEKNKGGRPTDYKDEYSDQAYKLCFLGAIDVELADFFGVCEKTINTWKHEHPEFLQSLKDGKEIANANVAKSLYQRALGYEHEDTHVSNYQGEITLTNLTKHYPPDTTAGIFWLKNRKADKWKDKHEIEHSGNIGLSEKLSRAIERKKDGKK